MKKTLKTIVSLLLTLAIMLSITVSLDASFFASDISATEGEDMPAIENVKTIRKSTKHTDKIELFWDAVQDKDVLGYNVYIKNLDKDKEFSKLTTVLEPKISILNLDHTTPYEFKVTAYKMIDDIMYESDGAFLQTATQPATQKAPALKRSSTVIGISWAKNAKADGYVIYRASYKTGGKWAKYKTIANPATTSFEDKGVEYGRSYFYKVVSYRTPFEGRTYYGEGAMLKAIAGLSAPTLSSCTTQLSRVSLVWNKNKLAQGYYVYYATEKAGPYKLLKDTKNNWYNTARLTNGKKYYFRVVPYRTNGNHKITGSWLALDKTVSNKAYGKNIGKTYIEISIKQQRMWHYIDGKLYTETPVVTGNYGYYSTPKGAFKVMSKASPTTLSGPTWNVNVSYWLQFTGSGCGIHDSTWRRSSEYGGTTYIGNGSHGCVNTPKSIVKKIYSKAKLGTAVVVY